MRTALFVHVTANTIWTQVADATKLQNGNLRLRSFDIADPNNAPLTKPEATFTNRERELIVQAWMFMGK